MQFSNHCAIALSGFAQIIYYLSIYTISQRLVFLVHQVLCAGFVSDISVLPRQPSRPSSSPDQCDESRIVPLEREKVLRIR